MEIDRDRLVRDLTRAVEGDVLGDVGSRAAYSADASNYRHVPEVVVRPRTVEDICATLEVCWEHRVPLTPRGGGTSVSGNAVGRGVVLDTSRHLDKVLDVDGAARTAVVQPGVIAGDLAARLRADGLAFAPDPSTAARCTIGGMIGNNACGAHSIAWGKTSDNVCELDVVLADGTRMTLGAGAPRAHLDEVEALPGRVGEVHRLVEALTDAHLEVIRRELGRFPRQVSGYNLTELLPERRRNLARALVGSEGTCAVVLSATVDLIEPPRFRAMVVAGYRDEVAAAEAVPALLEHHPLAIEGLGRGLLAGLRPHGDRAAAMRLLPDSEALLIVEIGGDTEHVAAALAKRLAAGLGDTAHAAGHVVVTDPRAQRAVWSLRADGAGLATRTPGGTAAYPGWEDSAVPPERLPAYLRDLRAMLGEYGYPGVSYGHFGEGCIHMRLGADLTTDEGVARYRDFLERAADLVAAHGGSLAGEHGDGQARSALLARTFSPEAIGLFREFKRIWDPGDLLNPGVLVAPRAVDSDIRWLTLGRREVDTELAYPDDDGSFRQAVSRCVGVGKCRVEHGAAMCPSYQATREEKHSTRGRARLLFEMLAGEVVEDGWRSEEVLDSLDLCLSCKACKNDCPVGVDMAAYKSEFLYQHYRHRLRPRSHYAMGRLPMWARWAARAPRLVNALAARDATAAAAKRLGGIDSQRDLPHFARRTFRAQFQSSAGQGVRGEVVLWPDTFTDHFSPEAGLAAVRVLEDAGYRVLLPPGRVCCGLTALSTGQLALARRTLRRSLRTLEPQLRQGVPIVGLEPSCTMALRADAVRLLPDDERAHALADSVVTFAELLADRTPGWEPPSVAVEAVVQTHCHQLAESGDDADRRLMARADITRRELPPGCCGLAGNFGFESGHFAVSQRIGEQSLFPAVRDAPPETAVLADGFSCRTQIQQGVGRPARHVAELLAESLDGPRI